MKKILHISDIHASIHPTKGQARQKVEMLTSALLEDVDAISDVDTVVVSGDITFSGQREEFGLFISEIIEPLKEKMGLENDDSSLPRGTTTLIGVVFLIRLKSQ